MTNVTMTHGNFFVEKKRIMCQTKQYTLAFSKKKCIPNDGNVGTPNKAFYSINWRFGQELIFCKIKFSCLISFRCMLGGHHCGGLNEELTLLVRQRPNSFWHPKGFIVVHEQYSIMVLTTCIDMSKFKMSQYRRKYRT